MRDKSDKLTQLDIERKRREMKEDLEAAEAAKRDAYNRRRIARAKKQ